MEKNLGTGLRSLAAGALGLALISHAPAAKADCKEAAEKHLASFPNAVTMQATLSTDTETAKPLKTQGSCVEEKDCIVAFFHQGTKPKDLPPAPSGFVGVETKWKEVLQSPGVSCSNLFEYHFEKKAGPSTKPVASEPLAPAPTEQEFTTSKANLLKATTADAALIALKEGRVRYTSPTAAGSGQGAFGDAAGEAMQILGQIVVDRASNKGYALLQARLKTALKCTEGKDFPKSCAVLGTLRIQDIAMAPEVLARALAQDLLNLVRQQAAAQLPAAAAGPKAAGETPGSAADEAKLREALFELALSLVTSSGISRDLALRNAISELTLYATQKAQVSGLPAAQQAAVLGALAFARCIALNNGTTKTLGNCNVEAELDALSPPDPKARPAALKLAQQLVAIGAAEKASNGSARLALDTVAATACMVLQNKPEPKLECGSIETATTLDDATKVAFAGAFADALLDKDAATFVVVAAKFVDLKWAAEADEDDRKNKRSALRLLTGILDYAATYADKSDDASAEDKHGQRTKILESLTKDMTDRAGRGGDCIWSLGGALRAEGGARVATHGKDSSFYGPVGLPLGLAFDTVPSASDGWGFHLQFDAVNLGNYLALDNGPKVKKPEPGDVFAPGLTLGAGYGQDLPVVIGAFFSYTPQFVVDPNELDKNGDAKRGSINFGATVGIHVPLLDMN